MFDIYHHVIYSDIVQDTFQFFHVIVLEPANIGAWYLYTFLDCKVDTIVAV